MSGKIGDEKCRDVVDCEKYRGHNSVAHSAQIAEILLLQFFGACITFAQEVFGV